MAPFFSMSKKSRAPRLWASRRDLQGGSSSAPARPYTALPASQTAPALPIFEQFTSRTEDDMTGTGRSHEDASSTTTGRPLRSAGAANMPALTSTRNVSGPLAVESASMTFDAENSSPSRSVHSNGGTVIPAGTKTSTFIDRITRENEKLKRELRAVTAVKDEEAERVSAARLKEEDSRHEFLHLQVLAETNNRAIERKDRKLEELKAMLDAEVKRRISAEQRAEEALKMLGDTRSETQRQLAAAYEMKHLAETNAEAARDGYKRITDSYDKKLKSINEELNELRRERMEDADNVKRQAIVSDQLFHELKRTRRTEAQMEDMMGKYQELHRKELDDLVKEAKELRIAVPTKEKQAARLVQDMKETRDKMNWVIAQKKR